MKNKEIDIFAKRGNSMKTLSSIKANRLEKKKIGNKKTISIQARAKKLMISMAIYLIITCLAYIILYPFIIKILSSFKSINDLYDETVNLIPKHLSFDIVAMAMQEMGFNKALMNSLILTSFVSILQLISATMIGYGLARFKFIGRNLLFVLVIVSLLIPAQTTMTAMYLNFRYFDLLGLFKLITGNSLNLIDTIAPFGLLGITGFGLKNGLYIYLSMQFFKGIPKELEEAAYVDGAGAIRTFRSIMLPNAVPIMITIFLFSSCWQWTDTYYSGLFLNNWSVLPRSISKILTYDNGLGDPILVSAMTNAAILMIIAPLVVLYIFCQKYFVQGIEKSGLVG